MHHATTQPVVRSVDCRRCGPRARPVGRGGLGGGGFTIVELLVVTAIIILIVSILIIALNAATRSAQNARTVALMSQMSQAVTRFKADIGYLPPVLGAYAPSVANQRDLFQPFDPDAKTYPGDVQSWYSHTTVAEYLVGYSHHQHDGYGYNPDEAPIRQFKRETPPLGIRHPGPDGVWHATLNNTPVTNTSLGLLANRMKLGGLLGTESNPLTIDQGKVFGPYLELQDQGLLGAITGFVADGTNGLKPVVVFQGDILPVGVTWESLPKVVVDFWGTPIRYYRRPYPPGAIAQAYRSLDRTGDGVADRVPTLSDFYFLRPYTIPAGADVTAALADTSGDVATTNMLEIGEYALFSHGPDTAYTQAVRVDPDNEFNRDNLLEVGP